MTTERERDLARLTEIADLLDDREMLFHERRLIWARRIAAGDCATTSQPNDSGQAELARVSRVRPPQVSQATAPELVERAREALAKARGSR